MNYVLVAQFDIKAAGQSAEKYLEGKKMLENVDFGTDTCCYFYFLARGNKSLALEVPQRSRYYV